MATAASSLLGVTTFSTLASASAGQVAAAQSGPRRGAKHIIYLFMNGAMSHLDTFDPKVGVEEAGETKATQTRVPGIQFSERLPKLSYLAGALGVVRSLTTETGAHEQGRYLMRTAYKQINSIQHPGMGAWMIESQGRISRALPGNYLIGSDNRHPGSGFLSPSFSPVPVANPSGGLQNTKLPGYLKDQHFDARLKLARKFDVKFRGAHKNTEVLAYDQMYEEARKLMSSEDLKVFDLKEEPEKVRETYGQNTLGQGCLLARRLVQKGARFVEVNYGGWDMHQNLYESLDTKAQHLDDALSSLLRDLNSKGLLRETMVVVATEFGRTPKINENAGRDHHPGVFCGLMAGAGIRGGQVIGASDAKGFSVDEYGVTPADFNKTIAAAAGLPLDKEFYAPNGRPFKIGHDGETIDELLL
ncbi:MAG: DUF1501 domain-containing protein [Planctomycetota bacterium]